MTKADKKMRLVMETAMLLHNEKLEGEWSERLQVVVPKDKEAVAAAWITTAQKINTILNLPKVKMENTDWTNTATTVDELYDDAKQIAPFFSEMCTQAVASFPRCSVNFGPDNRHMLKEKSSLIGKIKSDLGENYPAVVFHAPVSKERTALMIRYLSEAYVRQRQEKGYQPLFWLGKKIVEQAGKEEITSLQELSANWITDDDLSLLGDLVPRLTDLTISNNQFTGSGLASLSSLPSLKQLSLKKCDALNDSELANLSHLKKLTKICISKCNQITGSSLGSLSSLPNLKQISLRKCTALTDRELANLSHLKELTEIFIKKCDQITGSSLASLNSLKNLRILTLSECNQITYSNLGNLSNLITAKCSIEIDKCKNIRFHRLNELSGLTDEQCRKIGVRDPAYKDIDYSEESYLED